jgi:hypothetical protein
MRWQGYMMEISFGVNKHKSVVAEIAELMQLDFVSSRFVVIPVSFAGAVTPWLRCSVGPDAKK